MGTSRAPVDWLTELFLGAGAKVPAHVTAQLMKGLFSSVPIFLGGIVNTIVVAAIATGRHPTAAFVGWLAFEIVLGAVRLAVLAHGRRAVAAGRTPPRLLAALLSCTWSVSVGVGTFLCLTSGDWALAAIACMSATAMVCGICLRNFGTPRLAAAMIVTAVAPCAVAGLLTDEPIMAVISVQLPLFTFTIVSASFSLHRLLVSRMTALGDLERSLTLNETILLSSPDHTMILDEDYRVVFHNRPNGSALGRTALGLEWPSLVAEEERPGALHMLDSAKAGCASNFMASAEVEGQRLWFDLVASKIDDGSGRLMVVSRDITHQKRTEEKAVWRAQHDTLTGLPNRVLLQDRLATMMSGADRSAAGALLLLDIDNFKGINDTLGHDAGDALLCAFASRLEAAVDEEDLVARTGGDEFALILSARSDAEVQRAADRIFAELREPFRYGDRQFECGASIGASFIRPGGAPRSEVMKSADIALYAAKAAGRAQLAIFRPAMMEEVERHQSMIASARYALQRDTIVPHYQPKVSLQTGQIVGFEALLRWRDRSGVLRGPGLLGAAFDDPVLGTALSERMLEKILDDIQHWIGSDVPFNHVAINVAAVDFRSGGFAETVLSRLAARDIPPSCIQIEVTETMFLGQGAGDVERALRRLSESGIRIALDDFGTGYASLSHLNQFPVDLIKIDRSFVQKLGSSADADAISAAVVNLGRCLDLEVIAEGIETPAQELRLIGMGCNTGQGFLYSEALPAASVQAVLDSHDLSEARALRA